MAVMSRRLQKSYPMRSSKINVDDCWHKLHVSRRIQRIGTADARDAHFIVWEKNTTTVNTVTTAKSTTTDVILNIRARRKHTRCYVGSATPTARISTRG